MDFEWDETKYRTNLIKHGIDFADAATIFSGWTYTVVDDRFDYGEERKISTGKMRDVLIVVVIHTDRGGVTRLISARPASAKERKTYETALLSALDDGRAG
jgi:uncharacterized protein